MVQVRQEKVPAQAEDWGEGVAAGAWAALAPVRVPAEFASARPVVTPFPIRRGNLVTRYLAPSAILRWSEVDLDGHDLGEDGSLLPSDQHGAGCAQGGSGCPFGQPRPDRQRDRLGSGHLRLPGGAGGPVDLQA